MANSDRHVPGSYERDAFDNPPKGPAGVHRGGRSFAARTAPFMAVVLVAALCGLGAWAVLSGEIGKMSLPWSNSSVQADGSGDSAKKDSSSSSSDGADSEKQSGDDAAQQSGGGEASQDAQGDAGDDQAQAEADAAAQAEQEAQQQAAQPNRATAVRVVNGTSINGYAADRQSVLQQAGYTDVTAANPSGSLPSYTVVWYENESDLATAQDVAAQLGIADVQQVSGLAAPIVVVLLG